MWPLWLILGFLAALVGGIAGLLRAACERVEEWAIGLAFVAAMKARRV